ncbi:hypothetical protein C6P40_000717 [Pichia californica]|uniref:Vta1 C-terminal domain-containing protein n=1 Tax=Pichia californica TaxID=460514 RepID=A0A9P6WKG4_9ASCO|nr:hypothetical protein C6P40_000717 [[Candida] californica]
MSESETPPFEDPLGTIPQAATKLISPFIKRGKELHTAQPLISYYCYLYSAQLILESKLHLQDAEVAEYIEILLNYIESIMKEINTNNLTEIINDKVKSFKLILSFSLSIFNKSFNEINMHTSSIKTVVNFKAFLDFIQVLNLWPDLYTQNLHDFHNQIKYAKFHSSRILKDIKANRDPNDYITPQDESELSQFISEPSKDDTSQLSTLSPTLSSQYISDNKEAEESVNGNEDSWASNCSIDDDDDDDDDHIYNNNEKENNEQKAPVVPAKPPTIPSKPVIKYTAVNQTQDKQHILESKILSKKDVEEIWTKSDIMSNAQRKAKFAISALNYEDIETAITELQGALKLLRGE